MSKIKYKTLEKRKHGAQEARDIFQDTSGEFDMDAIKEIKKRKRGVYKRWSNRRG